MAHSSTTSNIIIVGAGVAGLVTALELAPRAVTIISPAPLEDGIANATAQGGIAAALGHRDTPAAHARDTIAAGADIVEAEHATLITAQAINAIDALLALGVPFDHRPNGNVALHPAPGHAAGRIVRVNGDGTAKALMTALITAVRATASITVLEDYAAEELITEGDGAAKRVTGLILARNDDVAARFSVTGARAVILATGGTSALYRVTTNPAHARGDGLAIGARCGAIVANAEFVQFHPTAIDLPHDPAPLAPDTLCGSGATLIDANGQRFMADGDQVGEHASRADTARAIHTQIANGQGAFLDATAAIGSAAANRFPAVYADCMRAGIDPSIEPIPVAPAAHHHIGGLRTDANARTNIEGLWAVGEVANTGLHGANCLAANALLEAVVMACRAAANITQSLGPVSSSSSAAAITRKPSQHLPDFGARSVALAMIRETMSNNVGLERDATRLRQALATLKEIALAGDNDPVINNATIAARFIAEAALRRRESRGAHIRSDYPHRDPNQARSRTMTLAGLSLRDSLASGELFSEITAAGGTLH